MAMGRRKRKRQMGLWVERQEVTKSPGHPFYEKLNQLLDEKGFDQFVEGICSKFYVDGVGRPSIPPGVYFRMLLVGFFERLESERGIAWRCADSLALRGFLGYDVAERTPEHSSLCRIRQLIDLETHQDVFRWVVTALGSEGLVDGKTLGIDATSLEANAALRSIVRRDTGESYDDFLKRLAKESGIETPTREDLSKLDKKRKKKGSNDDWTHPHDPDSQITKMKDGRTHLAHKNEHIVDMATGVVLAVTLQGGTKDDRETMNGTLDEADTALFAAQAELDGEGLNADLAREVVGDKGYHSNASMTRLKAYGYRSYISEPNRGKRRWAGDEETRDAVYENRRRIKGRRGRRLIRRRGELLERPFAHYLDQGGMRRTHLRGHPNILKRLLVHVAGFNLGLLMRDLYGRGTPKELAASSRAHLDALCCWIRSVLRFRSLLRARSRESAYSNHWPPLFVASFPGTGNTAFSTGC